MIDWDQGFAVNLADFGNELACQGKGCLSPPNVIIPLLLSCAEWGPPQQHFPSQWWCLECRVRAVVVPGSSREDTLLLTMVAWGRGHATFCLLPARDQGADSVHSWTMALGSKPQQHSAASACFSFVRNSRENHQREKKKGFKNKAK